MADVVEQPKGSRKKEFMDRNLALCILIFQLLIRFVLVEVEIPDTLPFPDIVKVKLCYLILSHTGEQYDPCKYNIVEYSISSHNTHNGKPLRIRYLRCKYKRC